MKTYQVEIIETRHRTFTVTAESKLKAGARIKRQYDSGTIDLVATREPITKFITTKVGS